MASKTESPALINSLSVGAWVWPISVTVMVLAVLSGLVLRWYHLGAQSLWFDEGLTAFGASLSPAKIVRYAQSSDFPPLYYLLQHYWGILFGNSEARLRSLAAVCGTVSLPLFYFFAKRILHDSMAVALAMWLFAFSSMQIWFSREARTYELASALALVTLYALIRFLDRRSLAWFVVIVLSTTASLYLHNMMFFYFLALNVMWLTYPSDRSSSGRLKEVLCADFVAAALYLPWIPSLLQQVSVQVVGKGFWAQSPTVSVLFRTLALVSGFNLDYLFAIGRRVVPEWSWFGTLVLVGLLAISLLAGGTWGAERPEKRKLLSLVLYGLIPFVAVFLFSQVSTPVFTERIFTNSSIIAPIVFAYPLAVWRRGKVRTIYVWLGVILSAVTALSAIGYLRYQQKEDWRGSTAELLGIQENKRLIVFVSRTGEILFDYYATQIPHVRPTVAKMGLPIGYSAQFPPPRVEAPIMSLRDIAQLTRAVDSKTYTEIDLVLSHEIWDDPHELVLGYLTHAFDYREEHKFYGISVMRFSMAPFDESVSHVSANTR